MGSLNVRSLKATCAALLDDALKSGASEHDVELIKPGGEDNPKRDGAAWMRFYGQLQLLRGRAQGRAETGAVASTLSTSADDAVMLGALAAEPTVVAGIEREFTVHPKSLATLMHCHARELMLSKLTQATATLRDLDVANARLDMFAEAMDELAYQIRLLAWIATTKGPGLPFEESDRSPLLPQEMAGLDSVTVLQINRGFAKVNWVNLRAMQSLMEPDPEAADAPRKRPSWSPFFSALSMETGVAPETLIKDRALVSVLAMTQLAASSHREAMNEAKRKAEQRRAG